VHEQPTSLDAEKVPIDVDNGRYNIKGNKILVIQENVKVAH
jgi:hypothetical protein